MSEIITGSAVRHNFGVRPTRSAHCIIFSKAVEFKWFLGNFFARKFTLVGSVIKNVT